MLVGLADGSQDTVAPVMAHIRQVSFQSLEQQNPAGQQSERALLSDSFSPCCLWPARESLTVCVKHLFDLSAYFPGLKLITADLRQIHFQCAKRN